jgi:hypothetical protein
MNRRTVSAAPGKPTGLLLAMLFAAAALWHAPARAQADREVAYAGLGAGIGNYKWRNNPGGGNDICGFAGQISCEDSPVGFKAFVGYNLSPYLGVEGGYYNAGRANLTFSAPVVGTINQKVILNGYSLSAVGTLPFGPAFVSGRVGVAAATISRKDEILGSSELVDRTKAQAIYGVGGGFKVWRQVSVRLDWDRVRGETRLNEKFEADLITLNVMYRFE